VSSNGRRVGNALKVCMGIDLACMAWDHVKCRDVLCIFLQFLGHRNVETWFMKTHTARTTCTSLLVITISLLGTSDKQKYNYHWFAVDVFIVCTLLLCAEQKMSICTATRCWWSVTGGLTTACCQSFFLCRQGRQWSAEKQSMKFVSFTLPYKKDNNETIRKQATRKPQLIL
jgi:hypothetical protein